MAALHISDRASGMAAKRQYGQGRPDSIDSTDAASAEAFDRALAFAADSQQPEQARLLLLHHRDDFVQGDWPSSLRDGVAAQTARMESGFARFAQLVFGRAGRDEVRRAQFLLAEMPVGAVRQHLQHREPPPPIVDELIHITYDAVVADYHARRKH